MSIPVLDKPRIRQSFAAASVSYDRAAGLQRLSAIDLVRQAAAIESGGTLLDLGCGTGNLIELLAESARPKRIIGLDIAFAMIENARAKLTVTNSAMTVDYLCADAERLPLADASVDAVYSNLALQWCDPLAPVLAEARRVLKPGGRLQISTFGPRTLQELKAAWANVDSLPHVNEFPSANILLGNLKTAGFIDYRLQETVHVCQYPSVLDLMRELKMIGAHNVHLTRAKTLTGKARMQAMFSAYEHYRHSGLLPATYEIFLVTAQT